MADFFSVALFLSTDTHSHIHIRTHRVYWDNRTKNSMKTFAILRALLLLLGCTFLNGGALEISKADDFKTISANVKKGINYLGTTITLTSDIDFTGVTDFEPIGGSTSNYFSGVFDGQGYVIKNLNISSSSNYVGLFGYSTGLTIKNIVLDSSCSVSSLYEEGNIYIGGVIGSCGAAKVSLIENVVAMLSLTFYGKTNSLSCFGGIVGYSASSSNAFDIKNCAFYGKMVNSGESSRMDIGGIIGYYSDTAFSSTYLKITNCLFFGTIIVEKDEEVKIGGIIGRSGTTTIENSVATGKIQSIATGSVNGIIGKVDGHPTVKHCFWTEYIENIKAYDSRSVTATDLSLITGFNASFVETLNQYSSEYNGWLLNTGNKTYTIKNTDVNSVGSNATTQLLLVPDGMTYTKVIEQEEEASSSSNNPSPPIESSSSSIIPSLPAESSSSSISQPRPIESTSSSSAPFPSPITDPSSSSSQTNPPVPTESLSSSSFIINSTQPSNTTESSQKPATKPTQSSIKTDASSSSSEKGHLTSSSSNQSKTSISAPSAKPSSHISSGKGNGSNSKTKDNSKSDTTVIVSVVCIIVVLIIVIAVVLLLFLVYIKKDRRNDRNNRNNRNDDDVPLDDIKDRRRVLGNLGESTPTRASPVIEICQKDTLYPKDYTKPDMKSALLEAGLTGEQADQVCNTCIMISERAKEEGKLFDGFTEEDAAAIAMYTFDFGSDNIESNPYRLINKSLSSQDPKEIMKIRGILCLVMAALRKLPRVSNKILYRGLRGGVCLDEDHYCEGNSVSWAALTSTSPDSKATKGFLARGSNTGKASGTLFIIENGWGYDIQPYSLFPDEAEIVLEPGHQFNVKSVIDAEGITIVTLSMVNSPGIEQDAWK